MTLVWEQWDDVADQPATGTVSASVRQERESADGTKRIATVHTDPVALDGTGRAELELEPGPAVIRIKLTGTATVVRHVIVPAADTVPSSGVRLSDLTEAVAPEAVVGLLTTDQVGVLVPGFDSDGHVLDREGQPVGGGGGSSDLSGYTPLGDVHEALVAFYTDRAAAHPEFGWTPQVVQDLAAGQAEYLATYAGLVGLYMNDDALLGDLASAVDSFTAALAGKATPADITAAIAAIVDAAPASLDTFRELAVQLGADETAVASLTAVVGQKYVLPSGGIPSTDLAAAVVAALTDTRTPTNGTVSTAKVAAGGLAPSAVTGTAVVTTDGRLSDQRAPTDGSVTSAKIASAGLSPAKIAGGAIVMSGPQAFSPLSAVGWSTVPLAGAATTAALSQNAMWLQRFPCGRATTLTAVGVQATVAGGTGGTLRFDAYQQLDDASMVLLGNLGSVAADAAAAFRQVSTSLAVAAGFDRLFLAITAKTASGGTFQRINSADPGLLLPPSLTPAQISVGAGSFSYVDGNTAAPATIAAANLGVSTSAVRFLVSAAT